MNESTIAVIAEAVLANTRVLEKLIDALPVEVKAAVQEKVANVAPVAPVAPAPAPVVQVAPTMPAPPVFTPPVAPAPAPIPTAPVVSAAPAPVTASLSKAPFSDPKGLIDFVMSAYKALGPQKGAGIQGVLTGLGYQNINDVSPAHYDALAAGIEALK